MKMLIYMVAIAGIFGISMAANGSDTFTMPAGQELGRVFMSADERWRLDAERGPVSVEEKARTPAVSSGNAAARKRNVAAGYIVVPSGTHLVWSEGDFREVDRPASAPRVHFPGIIIIKVHPATSTPTPDTAPDKAAPQGRSADTSSHLSGQSDDTPEL